jgi:glycosyltransferase involved in cell wall biosynthesis
MAQVLNRTVVFVLPWHVRPAVGGPEAAAAETAQRLARAGARVEIWTTTAHPGDTGRSPNLGHFPAGEAPEDAVVVRRFPAEQRDARLFAELNKKIRLEEALSLGEEGAFFRNWVWSEPMRREIHRRRQEALFLFAPIFAATTVFGVAAAPQESVLLPCLHTPLQVGYRLIDETFAACHHFLFASEPERVLIERLFDFSAKRCLTAAGVKGADRPPSSDAALPAQVRRPYALALGRPNEARGAPELIDYFRRLVADSPLPFRLVLAGAGMGRPPPAYADHIIHLGQIEEPVKWALVANAECYILASERETLSLSLLESWLCGRPAVVNGGSSVASTHARISGGGLTYHSYGEFRAALEILAREPDLASALGRQGQAYVNAHFRWSDAISRQLRFLRDIEQWLAEANLAA